jgi:very-short-patch-repair endonuclease
MTLTKPAKTVRRAKRLRREMTPPEVYLWQHFRQQPDGIKIRRQHPLGPYILDFFCAQAKLAIEVDGIAHDMGDNPERDLRRDAHLTAQGIETVRVAAADIMKNSPAVADSLFQMIKARIG